MRTSREEFLIERIFSKYGDALGGSMSVEDAYEELKKLSGEDFGPSELEWRNWLEKCKLTIALRVRSQMGEHGAEKGSGA